MLALSVVFVGSGGTGIGAAWANGAGTGRVAMESALFTAARGWPARGCCTPGRGRGKAAGSRACIKRAYTGSAISWIWLRDCHIPYDHHSTAACKTSTASAMAKNIRRTGRRGIKSCRFKRNLDQAAICAAKPHFLCAALATVFALLAIANSPDKCAARGYTK